MPCGEIKMCIASVPLDSQSPHILYLGIFLDQTHTLHTLLSKVRGWGWSAPPTFFNCHDMSWWLGVGLVIAGSTPGRGAIKSTRSTQPSIAPGKVNWVPARMAGVRRGAFTCVGWQVTLCDPIWQVTSRSTEVGSQEEVYRLFSIPRGFEAEVPYGPDALPAGQPVDSMKALKAKFKYN